MDSTVSIYLTLWRLIEYSPKNVLISCNAAVGEEGLQVPSVGADRRVMWGGVRRHFCREEHLAV